LAFTSVVTLLFRVAYNTANWNVIATKSTISGWSIADNDGHNNLGQQFTPDIQPKIRR